MGIKTSVFNDDFFKEYIMLAGLFQQTKNKFNELKNEALKYKSKKFLHAALAGSALVIMADGEISSEEKVKMIAFIENNEALSIYNTSEVLTVWKDYINTFEIDADIGHAKAMTAIGKIKGQQDEAKLVLRMVCAIGASDGDFDKNERQVASKIAIELGLDAKEFDLA
jgi:tellurite resistance protein TerB